MTETILSLLTAYELTLLEKRVWASITLGSGYQPYGFDRPTLRITHPNELAALDAIRGELTKRNPSLALPRRSNVA